MVPGSATQAWAAIGKDSAALHTGDAGQSWQQVSLPLPVKDTLYNVAIPDAKTIYFLSAETTE